MALQKIINIHKQKQQQIIPEKGGQGTGSRIQDPVVEERLDVKYTKFWTFHKNKL